MFFDIAFLDVHFLKTILCFKTDYLDFFIDALYFIQIHSE